MVYQSIPGSGFHYLNSPSGYTTFTKVFVGGLAWETQSEALRRHFDSTAKSLNPSLLLIRTLADPKDTILWLEIKCCSVGQEFVVIVLISTVCYFFFLDIYWQCLFSSPEIFVT